MASRSTNIKVGLTVVIAFLVAVAGTIWLAQVRLSRSGYTQPAVFSHVGGLDVGDPITVAGVERGHVKNIELRHGDVLVTLWLSEGTVIPEDSRVAVENIGLMGEKFVSIMPGVSSVAISPGAELHGEYHAGLPEVVGSVGDVMPRIARLADLVERALAGGEGDGGGGPGVLAELETAARELRAVIAENREDLRQATKGFRGFSLNADQMVRAKREEIEETIERLAQASRKLDSAADRMERASVPMEEVARRLGAGEGTLGKLVQDDQLYRELRRTVHDLDSLIMDIRENPRRYLKVEIF